MEYSICIACETRLKFLGKIGGFSILQCPKCLLGVTKGSEARGQYNAYHRDEVYIAAEEQFKNIFEKRVNILQKFKDSGSALEVGSSTGLLLSLLEREGWRVQGIEPSKTAVQAALLRGVPTLNTTFEEAKISPVNFDAVILNHVLEHIEDPLATLKKARKILKKDGLILIDVPNFGSISARARGVNWGYTAPNEHLWHFTKVSLFLLLTKTGFVPISWEARSGIWDYGNPGKEIWESFVSRKKRFLKNVLTLFPTFVITKLKMGTSLTVVARKSK